MLQSTTDTSKSPNTQSLTKYSAKLPIDTIPIRMINFRHLQTKNIKAFEPFPKLVNHRDNINGISKACRNSDFVKTLTLHWKDKNSRQFPLLLKNLRLFSENIKYLSSLKALDLQFPPLDKLIVLTDDGMEQLCQGIKRLNSLEKFRLCIGGPGLANTTLHTQGLKRLGQALKRLALLKEIDLDFDRCREMTNEGLIELSKSLRRCRSLKKLSLRFINCYKIRQWGLEGTSKAIGELSKDIKKLGSLEVLKLDFSVREGDFGADVDLGLLSESLKKLVHLKEIKLNFARRGRFLSGQLGYLNDALNGLKFLRKVELNFGTWFKIRNEEFIELCELLGNMGLLRDLTLNFEKCPLIKDEGLCRFGAILEKMSELENLHLNFQSCQEISNIGREALQEGVKQLTKIKKVKFQLSWGGYI